MRLYNYACILLILFLYGHFATVDARRCKPTKTKRRVCTSAHKIILELLKMDKSPEWINKELFEKSFRKFYKNDNILILGFSTKAAVATGENYTSYLFRSNVTFNTGNGSKESMSVIIKIQPVGTAMEVLGNEMQLFAKEIEMYSKTLPMMYDVLGTNDKGCFSSLSVMTSDVPIPMLILEDLQPHGFKMAARQAGLNYDHCAMVMKKIAKFHAASVVVVDNDPSTVRNYYNGIYTEDAILEPWLSKGFESLIESCMKWQGMERYAHKFRKFGKTILKRGVDAGQRKLGGFNVINHGDLWLNNMLFSYDENNKLKDMKFVDFQIVKYSSPALDLHYFFTTSSADEVREKYLDNLLDLYYGQLILSLSEMKYCLDTVPSRADFRKDYFSRGFYGIMAAATVLPLVKASQRDDATFEHLMSDDGVNSFRHHCFTNECYKNSLEIILPYYEKMGAFI